MAKDRESITIDKTVNDGIKEEAKKQRRSFSGMIEYICNEYLMALKKPKSEGKKKNNYGLVALSFDSALT